MFSESIAKIEGFLKDNLEGFTIVSDYMDLDKYKQNGNLLFVNIDSADFGKNDLNTDCGSFTGYAIDIYCVNRNDTVQNLEMKMLADSESVCALLKNSEKIPASMDILCKKVDFYRYAEANRNIFVSKISTVFSILESFN